MNAEQKIEGLRRAWPLWVGVITKGVVDKYGEEGAEVIKEALGNQGLIHGQKVFRNKRGMGSALKDFVDGYILGTVGESLGYDIDIMESTDSRIKVRVNRCPLWERWKLIDVPPDMCDIWDSYQRGVCRALNPANPIIHTHEKQLIKGDSHCELVWEIKQDLKTK